MAEEYTPRDYCTLARFGQFVDFEQSVNAWREDRAKLQLAQRQAEAWQEVARNLAQILEAAGHDGIGALSRQADNHGLGGTYA